MKNFKVDVVEKEGNFARLDLIGYLDAHTVEVFDKAMRETIESGGTRIVISFEGVDYISSAGIGSLMGFTHQIKQKNGDLVLFKLSDKVSKILGTLGLTSIFQIAETQEDLDKIISSS